MIWLLDGGGYQSKSATADANAGKGTHDRENIFSSRELWPIFPVFVLFEGGEKAVWAAAAALGLVASALAQAHRISC